MTVLLVTPDLRHEYMSVRWQVFVEEQNVPMMLEIDARDFSPATLHMAAYDDDEGIVGAMRLIRQGEDQFRLGRLAVRAHMRGRGVGRDLVETAHNIVRSHTPAGQASTIILEAQLQARDFYESLGYRATSDTIILDAGIEHIEMAVELHGT